MSDDECRDSEPPSSYPDSGPYCRHWCELGDCDAVCATCGHSCSSHGLDETPSECEIDGCACPAWIDVPPEPPRPTDAELVERQMHAQGLHLLADLSTRKPLSPEEATCAICREHVDEREKHMRFVNGTQGGRVVRGRLHERCAPADMDAWLKMTAIERANEAWIETFLTTYEDGFAMKRTADEARQELRDRFALLNANADLARRLRGALRVSSPSDVDFSIIRAVAAALEGVEQ